eukprot:SAG25_NODE_908_length_4802_cov_2.234106_5_plen_75_part_00
MMTGSRYAEFGSFDFAEISFHEFFEMDSDKWQMRNVYGGLSADEKTAWAKRVSKLFTCQGAQCRMAPDEALQRP